MRVPEAELGIAPEGLAAESDGWFVLNARDARWESAPGRSAICDFEGQPRFADFGINLSVLGPGEPLAMYHWEADQEGFLVLRGEPLLIVEGEERPLRQWDYVHCPAGAGHVIVGAGEQPCLVLAVGARRRSTGSEWGAYTPEPAALRHSAGVEQETLDSQEAYAGLERRQPVAYQPGWLPD
jgi:uncharacterized cupin superfamily protein